MVGANSKEHDRSKSISAHDFLTTLLGLEVGSLLKFDPIARQGRDPEGIHQLRVCARRLRSELKILSPAIKSAPLARLEADLQWVGRVLGQQRDVDVLLDLMETVNDAVTSPLESTVFDRLARRRASNHFRVIDVLESDRYRRLVWALADAVIHPPLRPSARKPAMELLRPQLIATLSDLFTTADGFGDAPADEELHRIRILAKRGRYSAEVAGLLVGEPAKNVGASLEKVQSVLGGLHDRLVAIEFLRERSTNNAEGMASPASRSTTEAIKHLTGSVEELKTRWREPLEAARSASRAF